MLLHINCTKLFFPFQLQVLIDDSARLQETYPGGNADQIAQQQSVVVENWGILQEKAQQRKDDLQAAEDFFRFMAAVCLFCPIYVFFFDNCILSY